MPTRIPINTFVKHLESALSRGDGYIMGAYGQNPRTGYVDLSVPTSKCRSSWKETGYYFAGQYKGAQLKQALKWREKCMRVWDCNGLAEGIYEILTGTCINSRARYNYATWCSVRGAGMIPVKYRVPGAAVFWSDGGAGSIHHVAYLYEPVIEGHPEGDWWMIEARGVMYGVVKTRLLSRKPNFWGWMDKYYDYSATALETATESSGELKLGDRTLKNGGEGSDVKELQSALIRLGYDLGRWGADGSFGDATEAAVRAFQRNNSLSVDGIVGAKTIAALGEALVKLERAEPTGETAKVQIQGGQCYCREEPSTAGKILGVAHEGVTLEYGGEISENGWLKVVWKDGVEGWVSGKYGRLI